MRCLVVVVVTLGGGCDSAEKRIEKHEPVAAPILAHYQALGPIIAKQPPVTERMWQVPEPLVLDTYADGKPNPAYNTGVTFAEYIVKLCDSDWRRWTPDAPGSGPVSMMVEDGEEWLLNVACYLQRGKPWWVTEMNPISVVERHFWQFEHARYVAAIRLRDLQRPGLVMAELEAKQIEHFRPGHVRGDVLVYEVATQKLVGAFPLDAQLPDTVEVRSTSMHDQLEVMLTDVASRTVKARLEAKPAEAP
jgi:hypothetical protein